MTFIRKGVFAEIGKLRVSRGDDLKLGALNPVTSPKKRREDKERTSEDFGRNWGDTARSRGPPWTAGHPKLWEEAGAPSAPPEGTVCAEVVTLPWDQRVWVHVPRLLENSCVEVDLLHPRMRGV